MVSQSPTRVIQKNYQVETRAKSAISNWTGTLNPTGHLRSHGCRRPEHRHFHGDKNRKTVALTHSIAQFSPSHFIICKNKSYVSINSEILNSWKQGCSAVARPSPGHYTFVVKCRSDDCTISVNEPLTMNAQSVL